MAIDFPASPTLNDLFGADDKLWQWDGVAWTAYLAANNASLHGASHGAAGLDPVTIAQSQVTGLTTSLSGKASTTHALSHASGGSDAITLAQSQVTSLVSDLAAKIPVATINAKGDLLVGAANDSVNILGVGTNGQLLTADSAQTYGIKWTNAPDTGITPFLMLGV
jgi:hypothetical protein